MSSEDSVNEREDLLFVDIVEIRSVLREDAGEFFDEDEGHCLGAEEEVV